MDLSQNFHQALKSELVAVYRNLRIHGSVCPADRYRAEGFCRAGLQFGLIDIRGFTDLLCDVHQAEFGESFASRQGLQAVECIDDQNNVRLPVRMERAPVWPSTGDA